MENNFKEKSRVFLILSIFFSLGLCILVRYLFIRSGDELGVDVFYHIRMADLFPSVCISKIFPWVQLSIWKNHFYDKELGFHAILYLFRNFSYLTGISYLAPFNFISACLVCIVMVAFSLNAYLKNVRISYLIPIMLVAISPLFLLRLSMIRPQIISIILYGCVFFILNSKKNKYLKIIIIFFLSWIYAISYSSPQIVFVAIFSCICADLILKRKNTNISGHFYIFLAAISGIIVGLTIHPQYPNTFYGWYIQGVLVIQKILGSSIDVNLGDELERAPMVTMIWNSTPLIFYIITVILFYKLKKKRKTSLSFLIASTIMIIGFFFSQRCVEYAVPTIIMGFVFTLEFYLRENYNPAKRYRWVKPGIIVYIVMIILFAALLPISRKYFKGCEFFPCYGFGQWAAKNLKEGSYVGQIRWGEFPRLFYVAPQLRYSMAMDPMFSYAAYPKQTEELNRFVFMKNPLKPKQLSRILKTNIVFISGYDPLPAQYLIKNGGKVLYKGFDGYVIWLN